MKKMPVSWPTTKVTQLLGISFPIIQAPMAGGATIPELVAAVSNAGGLGSFAAGYLTAEEIKLSIIEIRKLTDKPFAINLFVPEKHHATTEQMADAAKAIQSVTQELNFTINAVEPPYAPSFDEQMAVILDEKIPIFSFTFGIPADEWLVKFKHAGIKLIGTATTLPEASMLEDKEVDLIVAQGSEAGGHRGTFLGKAEDALIDVESLTSMLVNHTHVPIVSAGGIMDAKKILTLLKLGADGVQMGTAFLACTESGIHPDYKKLLLKTAYDNTTLTRAFSGKLARGLTNEFIIRMKAFENFILDYPIQNKLTSMMRKEAGKQNNIDFMSMWAGQAHYLCKEISAGRLVQDLNLEVTKLLKN